MPAPRRPGQRTSHMARHGMAKLDALSRAGTALASASRWFWPSSMAAAMPVSAGRMAVSTVAPKLPAVK